jgi:hypothetical protein
MSRKPTDREFFNGLGVFAGTIPMHVHAIDKNRHIFYLFICVYRKGATVLSTQYTGPPIGNPHATNIGTFTGLLEMQADDFRAALNSARAGYSSDDERFVMFPMNIVLTLNGGTLRSRLVGPSLGVNTSTGNVRFLVAKWNNTHLEWGIVKIEDNRITAKLRRNPPDPCHNWRAVSPTVVPCHDADPS